MKTEFELVDVSTSHNAYRASVKIIGKSPKYAPYVKFKIEGDYVSGKKYESGCIHDNLELFAAEIAIHP